MRLFSLSVIVLLLIRADQLIKICISITILASSDNEIKITEIKQLSSHFPFPKYALDLCYKSSAVPVKERGVLDFLSSIIFSQTEDHNLTTKHSKTLRCLFHP